MVIRHADKRDLQLSKRRKEGFFAAEDIDYNVLHYRICSRHFISGKPVKLLYDCSNSDWLPTMNLRHTKQKELADSDLSWYERARKLAEESVLKEQERQLLFQQAEIVSAELM